MFLTAAFSSAFASTLGDVNTGSRLKVLRPYEEVANLGLEADYLGRREDCISIKNILVGDGNYTLENYAAC